MSGDETDLDVRNVPGKRFFQVRFWLPGKLRCFFLAFYKSEGRIGRQFKEVNTIFYVTSLPSNREKTFSRKERQSLQQENKKTISSKFEEEKSF